MFHTTFAISPWDLLGACILPEEYKGIVNSQWRLRSCDCTGHVPPWGCAFLPSGREERAALWLKGICCGICHVSGRCWMCRVLVPGKRMLESSSWDVTWLTRPVSQRLEDPRRRWACGSFGSISTWLLSETWISASCSSLCSYTTQPWGKNIIQVLLSGRMAEAIEEAPLFETECYFSVLTEHSICAKLLRVFSQACNLCVRKQ